MSFPSPPTDRLDSHSIAASSRRSALTRSFRAGAFALDYSADWHDQSVYLLSGPTVDDLTHTIGITVDPEPNAPSLAEYAEAQIHAAADMLERGTVLLHDRVPLTHGGDAIRAVIRWQTPARPLFQQQMFVHTNDGAVVLAAPFTRRSRRVLGAHVQAMLCSLRPAPAPVPSTSR